MKLKDVIKQLAARPDQNEEVNYIVYGKASNNIVSMELNGKHTMKIIQILAKEEDE